MSHRESSLLLELCTIFVGAKALGLVFATLLAPPALKLLFNGSAEFAESKEVAPCP